MQVTRSLLFAAVAVPPLALAAVGITHPMHLTASSAEYWRDLHIAILPVFPLLGFAPWLTVRGRSVLLSWIVGILGFVYAAFYTALDVLAGIGAGGLKLDDMGMATGTLYGLGDSLGFIGSVALIAAGVVAGVVSVVRVGIRAIPGGVLVVVGAYLFLLDHIYFPVGVIGQLCLAAGWVWLVASLRAESAPRTVANRP
ncbi:hypothetical protein BH09ACT1_BH09ACT1_18060 [soil metagenome]